MTARKIVEFFVPGVPIPQGSKGAWVNPRTGKAVLMDTNADKLKPWRKAVTAIATAAHEGPAVEGAVQVEITFQFVRGKSVRRQFPAVKPDIDKLQRALFDGVTDAGVWKDDGQVVTVLARKVYAEEPGIRVLIGEYVTPTPQGKREK